MRLSPFGQPLSRLSHRRRHAEKMAGTDSCETSSRECRYPRDFRHEKNAGNFFPQGWLRLDLTSHLDNMILLAAL